MQSTPIGVYNYSGKVGINHSLYHLYIIMLPVDYCTISISMFESTGGTAHMMPMCT